MEITGVAGTRSLSPLTSMPVMDVIGAGFSSEHALAGARIFARMHVTRETAYLLDTLKRAGADVLLTASNSSTSDHEVQEWLWSAGIRVEIPATLDDLHAALGRFRPELLIDNGEAIDLLHDRGFDWPILGGTTHSTNAEMVVRDALARDGSLRFPVISLGSAGLKRSIETHHGVGQSVVQSLMNATGMQISSRRVAVVGYGNAGAGLATYLRGMNANVTVVETSAVRALAAAYEGFTVASLEDALPLADVVVTVTSAANVIGQQHFRLLRDGVFLGSVGHHPSEVDVYALAAQAQERQVVGGCVERFVVDGKRIFLLGGGHQLNHVCAGGNTSELMDLSLSLHVLALVDMWRNPTRYELGLHLMPRAYEEDVAGTKLRSLGYQWAGAAV